MWKAVPLAIAAVMGLSMPAANAGLVINPNGNSGGVQAQNEPPLNGGPGFPCATCVANLVPTFGYTSSSLLIPDTSGLYTFTFEGAGDAVLNNTFTLGGNSFIANGPGGTGAGSTPAGASFTVSLTAGAPILFSLSSSGGCAIVDGDASPVPGCNYLLALNNSAVAPGALGPQNTAWIGFSDGHTVTDADYQDMVVRVTAVVAEPPSWVLFGAALLGLFVVRRFKLV